MDNIVLTFILEICLCKCPLIVVSCTRYAWDTALEMDIVQLRTIGAVKAEQLMKKATFHPGNFWTPYKINAERICEAISFGSPPFLGL